MGHGARGWGRMTHGAFGGTVRPENMAAMAVSDGDSVKALADSFMTGWLAIENEVDGVSGSETREVALVNRMVQLFSSYVIVKLLKKLESSDTVGSTPAEGSRVTWQQVLQGGYRSRPGASV